MFHPVHVTFTSIDYVPESVSFKVFIRMNFDDFLLDCSRNGGLIKREVFSSENPATIKALEKYLSDKFHINANGNQLVAIINDLKVIDNELNIDLIYRNVKNPESLIVKSYFMTSLYSDQSNMVIIKINDFEKGVKLTSYLTEQTFKIK